jgi:Zn-dependent protease with chaperone function
VSPALALLGYAACSAWCTPALLTPLTSHGQSVRAGLAAWLAALAGVVLSVALAVQFSLRAVAADWPLLTQDLCRSVAGGACTPEVYRSLLYQVGVAVGGLLLSAAAAAALYRYGRRVRRSRSRTRGHARAALLVGRALPGAGCGHPGPGARTMVLDDPRPAAYCVAGRPAAIVVTSGALRVLAPAQLTAVLAHERAHLAGGHHALTTVVRGLAAAFPGLPLFARAAAEVGRLAEMSADDAAARAAGRQVVAAALLALATGQPVPGEPLPPAGHPAGAAEPAAAAPGFLRAAADAVPARVTRLLTPVRPAAAVRTAVLLAAITALLVAAPALIAALSG